MIRINLIGDATVTESATPGILIAYGASVVATIAICFFLRSLVTSDIAELTTNKGRLEAQLAELQKTTSQVRDFEAKRKELSDKLSVIATLKLSKHGPVRVVDDLNNSAPRGLWLTSIKEEKGVLEVNGVALDNAAIVELMKNLEGSDYFKSIDLVESTQVYLIRTLDTVTVENTRDFDQTGEKRKRGQGRASLDNLNVADSYRSRDLVHRLVTYEGLTKEQREGFDRGLFGFGYKVRAFTLRCGVNYAGKLVAPPKPAKTEDAAAAAPEADAAEAKEATASEGEK